MLAGDGMEYAEALVDLFQSLRVCLEVVGEGSEVGHRLVELDLGAF